MLSTLVKISMPSVASLRRRSTSIGITGQHHRNPQTADERSANMATPVGAGTKSQGIQPLTKRKAWKALQTHYKKVRELHLPNLFADDPKRGQRMTAEALVLILDHSKHRITGETGKLLS